MPSTIWDSCYLESDILALIEKIPVQGNGVQDNNIASNKIDGGSENNSLLDTNSSICGLQNAIVDAESACRSSLELIDSIVTTLHSINVDYNDITDRTNNLMTNCENLLEQQHTYHQTVEILKVTLEPFNDIEELSALLGIPFDPNTSMIPSRIGGAESSKNKSSNGKKPKEGAISMIDSVPSDGTAVDPRSTEFKQILERLAKASNYLKTHHDIMDKKRYQIWLENLENRAMSLIGKAMRELIEKAAKSCADLYQQKLYQSSGHHAAARTNTSTGGGAAGMGSGNIAARYGLGDDLPIESAAVYQKFRGLGYRLRELSSMLLKGSFAEAVQSSHYHRQNSFRHSRSHNDSHSRSFHISHHRNHQRGSKSHLGSGSADSATIDDTTAKIIESHLTFEVPVITEVKQGYVTVRSELLLPFIKDMWLAALEDRTAVAIKGDANAANNDTNGVSLCAGIRQAFSTLLRVTQLEQQLFESLFVTAINLRQPTSDTSMATGNSTGSGRLNSFDAADDNSTSAASQSTKRTEHTEVLSIIQTLSNATKDVLRPFIIRESEVDELCRVVSALSEDVRSQMLAMPVPTMILRQLLKGLDGTVSDAKERLSYCAEMSLRQEVQLFEPLPSQLAYPDILESYQKLVGSSQTAIKEEKNANMASRASISNVYETWYPPMRQALSLLSKLYGVVEIGVFEDFARRAVDLTVSSLKTGSEGVKRNRPGIHGDLFLVRHLLILREQLVPFELRMQSVEKYLDFSPTGNALQHLIRNAQSMWRFDEANGFLQLARSGIPRMQETQIDVKKDLDIALKNACFSLKQSAVKMLLANMDAFLAKVTAFVGTIPTTVEAAAAASGRSNNQEVSSGTDGTLAKNSESNMTPLLPPAACLRLKNQAFVRPERMKEMLEGVQSVLLQRVPDLKAVMTLYIDNNVARTILMKPILQDFEETKRKMDCVVASCLDPGQPRRDVELLLQTISMTVISELTH